jgi:hypothetical protein
MNRELERQRALLAALWRSADAPTQAAWRAQARNGRVAPERGLQAYRANAGASAERALAASFPVLRALIGEESFSGLARAWWHACPPLRGDLALLGAGLADFVARDAQLADVPYLADVARLEWLVARAECAPDAAGSAGERLASLQVLAEFPPRELFIALAPGAAVLRSPWPVASLWRAHRPGAVAGAFEEARARVAAQVGETVFVCRPEWAPRVEIVDEATACFLQVLAAGRDVGTALADAMRHAGDWAFEPWLVRAVGAGWLAGARHAAAPGGLPHATERHGPAPPAS